MIILYDNSSFRVISFIKGKLFLLSIYTPSGQLGSLICVIRGAEFSSGNSQFWLQIKRHAILCPTFKETNNKVHYFRIGNDKTLSYVAVLASCFLFLCCRHICSSVGWGERKTRVWLQLRSCFETWGAV